MERVPVLRAAHGHQRNRVHFLSETLQEAGGPVKIAIDNQRVDLRLRQLGARPRRLRFHVDANVQTFAQEELCDPRLHLIKEDAIAFLRRQPPGSFDLVFADALRGKYEQLDEALRVVKPGGFYIIDDMLPQPNWPEGHAAKVPVLIRELVARQDFRVVPMEWASGIVIAVRRQVHW